jgi:hypothetical protein
MDLDGGEWVEFTPRLNHAQLRRIRKAASDESLDAFSEGTCAMVRGWLLHDIDGRVVECPPPAVDGIPVEALDNLPADVVVTIGTRALEIAGGQPDPKGSGARSPSSSPARGSASRRSSATPSSSPIMGDGRPPTSTALRPTS